MKIEIHEASGYKRRGDTCKFTFRISGFGEGVTYIGGDRETYTESWAWAYMRRVGDGWVVVELSTHHTYKPPRNPTDAELINALGGSAAEHRAIKALGK